MNTIPGQVLVSAEELQQAMCSAPPSATQPEGWTVRFGFTAEDIAQARRAELSGSLDDWLKPEEDVYE